MPILCYHSVARGWDDPVSIEPEDFERHCALLARNGDTVPLSAVEDRLGAGAPPPRHAMVLTFDDGFADYLEHAVPIMKRHRLTATMYVVARSMEDPDLPVDWITGLDPADAPPLMSRDQVRMLHDAGWDIGSHSMRHLDLRTLTEDECRRDLEESREILSDLLGRHVTTLAYPFGFHADHVRRAAARAGYTCALALPSGPEEPGPYAVPRVGLYRGNGAATFRVKTRPGYLGLRYSAGADRARRTVARVTGR